VEDALGAFRIVNGCVGVDGLPFLGEAGKGCGAVVGVAPLSGEQGGDVDAFAFDGDGDFEEAFPASMYKAPAVLGGPLVDAAAAVVFAFAAAECDAAQG